MRAVIDTNVVISGFLSRVGAPAQVLEQWRQGAFDLLVSPIILAEYAEVFGYERLQPRLIGRQLHVSTPFCRLFLAVVGGSCQLCNCTLVRCRFRLGQPLRGGQIPLRQQAGVNQNKVSIGIVMKQRPALEPAEQFIAVWSIE